MVYSGPTLNPSGGVEAGRVSMQPSLHDELMAQVLDSENVQKAWKRVKSNKGAPGMDGMTLEDFDEFAREHWPGIRQAISDGSYQPQPVRRVRIPKPGGKGERLLGIPTITDRVIQQAIAQVLTPIFDPEFSESSFGFRPKRSAHGALRKIQRHVSDGNRIAVDIDLEKFFDNVDHDILMNRVARRVGDKRLLRLIGRFLRAGACDGDLIQPTDIGAPQGGALTPLTTVHKMVSFA